MLTEWWAAAERVGFDAREAVDRYSTAAGLDLAELGCDADAETIRDTAHAQPLIVALSILSWRIYQQATGVIADLCVGHSVGEISALAIAGILTDEDAVSLAAVRGRAMAKAAAETDTTMCALVGGKREDVLTAIKEAGAVVANVNGTRQVVAAGSSERIDALSANLPRGVRAIPLSVAGAFHTEAMAPAVPAVAAAVEGLMTRSPNLVVLSNADGLEMIAGTQAAWRISEQITAPVRWDLCQVEMQRRGVTEAIELAPSGVLAGLVKRDLPGVTTKALTPTDIAPSSTETPS